MKNSVQRRIYKINSKRFRLNKWNLTLTEENTLPEEIVKIGDNQIFEFIRQINGLTVEQEQEKIKELKSNIRKKLNVSSSIEELNKTTFLDELCFVVIDRVSDYHALNNKMILNGVNYKRLFATTGGVKTSTIIYAKEDICDELLMRVENNRNMNIEFSAGKLEAYKSLTFTNSVKVPNPNGVVIVKDCYSEFTEDIIIELDDSNSEFPTMEVKKNEKISVNVSDGYGIITRGYAEKISDELGLDYVPSGFLIRNSFLKGMVYQMDIKSFAKYIVQKNTITDIYGNEHNIDDVEMIIPESVFKLWQSYDNIEQYLNSCKEHGYSFRVAKTTPKILDNVRNLNYQFIQTLNIKDEDIGNLAHRTLSQIDDIVNDDYVKTILFTKGMYLTESNINRGLADYTKALMIEPNMIDDPFVKTKVHNMLKRKINDAKIGVLSVSGNFQTIVGDIFMFMQHCFELPKTGLLKKNEIYSKYWVNKCVNDLALFRAPMSSHNNIRLVSSVSNSMIDTWFGHLNGVMVLSAYDTITHALNGADFDGDAFYSTDDELIINSVTQLPCVICKQKTAPKKICNFDDFVTANINGFGDEIGSITNKITSMITKQVNYAKDSDEYSELEYRILCGQLYQQNAIDKIKSIQAKPMPPQWYSFKENIEERDENGNITKLNDFNIGILADKKPYFFIYNYPSLMKEYKTYISNANIKSLNLFEMKLDDLIWAKTKTDEMNKFINNYYKFIPVDLSPSLMNKICWYMESQTDGLKLKSKTVFNKELLKTDKEYSKSSYNKVKNIYEEYKTVTSKYSIRKKDGYIKDDDSHIDRDELKLNFIKQIHGLKIDSEDLANIIIDLCYDSNNSKQFAWDVVGNEILLNLLKKNNYEITIPILDEQNGEVEFNGHKFRVDKVKVGDNFADSN